MELLIIKCKDQYIRVKDSEYLMVNLDKASVFPMDCLETVQTHGQELGRQGFDDVQIKRLVLTEEDL